MVGGKSGPDSGGRERLINDMAEAYRVIDAFARKHNPRYARRFRKPTPDMLRARANRAVTRLLRALDMHNE